MKEKKGADLLKSLTDTLENVRERIRQHEQLLRENETRTRRSLIDPVLDALGWDTEDPSSVIHEYQVGNGRADYALANQGKPMVALEAKRLGEKLETHTAQMVTYANITGIPYCGMTDGNVWELYDVFDQKPLDEKKILSVSIADGHPSGTALQLLTLWKPAVEEGNPAPGNSPLAQRRQPEIRQGALPMEKTGWIQLTEFDHNEKPREIMFPDGQKRDIRVARDLVTETAAWLFQGGHMTEEQIPIRNGRKRELVAFQKQMSVEEKHRYKNIAGTPMRVYVNLSRENCLKATIKLARECGQKPEDIMLTAS